MKDCLLDLVQHTHDLGCIDLVKIVGDENTTQIEGLAEDLSVVVKGEYKNPVPDFVGTFGMPNLNKLKTLLSLQEYKEDAKLTITRKTPTEPDGSASSPPVADTEIVALPLVLPKNVAVP